MALKINLKPGEKLVVNGAVLVNGDRRASMLVQNKASILRQKDILLPEEATTPARRIYFAIMMMYLEPESRITHYTEFALRSAEFMGAIGSREGLDLCIRMGKLVMDGNLYQALATCRKLFDFEKERLAA